MISKPNLRGKKFISHKSIDLNNSDEDNDDEDANPVDGDNVVDENHVEPSDLNNADEECDCNIPSFTLKRKFHEYLVLSTISLHLENNLQFHNNDLKS